MMNPPSEEPILDPNRLAMLEKSIGAVLKRICDRYFVDCASNLDKISDRLAAGDSAGIRALAHQMKGASSSIGLPQLEQWFRLLEQAAADGTPIPENWLEEAARRLELARVTLGQRIASLS